MENLRDMNMAHWVKYLMLKHEDMSIDSLHPYFRKACVPITPVPLSGDRKILTH